MTISEIVSRANGRAGSERSWEVTSGPNPSGSKVIAILWYYRTPMLKWNVENPADPDVLGCSTGWGSVSDQGGMNTAFKVLGLPYRFDRDARGGGPRITELRRHPCGHVTDPSITTCTCARSLVPERRTVTLPYSEAAMHSRLAGMTLEAIEEAAYVNGHVIPREQRRGCYVITPAGARVPMLKSEAGWSG